MPNYTNLIFAAALLGASGIGQQQLLTDAFSLVPGTSRVAPSSRWTTASSNYFIHPSNRMAMALPVASKDSMEELSSDSSSVGLMDPPSSSVLSSAATSALEQQTMDESIFQFNKIMIDSVYNILCFLYPITGTKRDFARFFVLETVARVPYFAYLSVLHLRETFGEREHPDRMKTHYAQADNEYHHLLIMESLGGNDAWFDRAAAQSMAFVYYWYVIFVYLWNPPAAYHLSELIEDHAYNTYTNFLSEHTEKLKSMPAPDIAKKYYERDNPFLFDLFCCVKDEGVDAMSNRRPKLENLYDVFVNIRDDESEHWKTLCNLVQYNDMNAVPANQVESTKKKDSVITTSTSA